MAKCTCGAEVLQPCTKQECGFSYEMEESMNAFKESSDAKQQRLKDDLSNSLAVRNGQEKVINHLKREVARLLEAFKAAAAIPMLLHCPLCSARHIDEGEFSTKPHHTHACQSCGHVWRPALVATVGVQFLPGFENE